jgi:hypothetical protein
MTLRDLPSTQLSFCWTLCLVLLANILRSSAWSPSLEKPAYFSNSPPPAIDLVSRRDLVFQWTAAAGATAATILCPSSLPSWAADENEQSGLMSATGVADILHAVPTFTIVDAKGYPYMVVGEDAKVTGYFFTTFEEADRILKLAKTSADKAIQQAKLAKEPVDENPWNKARISTVPLDFAVTMVSNSLYNKNYFFVAPAESDIEDALEITGKKDLAEGKVPLFYMEDFTMEDPKDPSRKQSPLYFRKSELEKEFKRLNPGKELPKILVSELFAVLLEMVRPGGTDEELKSLVLVPPKGSAQKAKKCLKAGGKEPPFALGERNLVL